MIVLGLDTSQPACSAAVIRGEAVLAARSEPMLRGHQERLAFMVAEIMSEAGLTFAELDRIAVTVGPGSFTGLRVGLAFAKGLSLALDRPCVGIGALNALAASVDVPGLVVAAIDARRGQVYLQAFVDGAPVTAADALDQPAAAARLLELTGTGGQAILVGSAAQGLGEAWPAGRDAGLIAPLPEAVARLGAKAPLTPVRPLYLRAPDARLPA